MTAAYDFTAAQGETFDHTVTWKIDDVAVNVTGYTARLQIRKRHTSTATVASLTSGSGLTLGGSAGTIQIVLSATATAALAARRYVYDLELVSGGGAVYRVLEGAFVVTPEVTR